MAKKRVTVPIAGQDFSLPSTEVNDRSNFGQNIRASEGVVLQRPGHATYGTGAMSGAVISLGRYQQNDLTLRMLRFSSTKSEVYNTSTEAWDDITKSGVDWTGTEGVDYFDTAVFNNKILITNGIDNVQQYTGTGLCTDLSGSPPKAKFIEAFGEYVVLGHVIDGGNTFPYRIQWCDTGDETDWTNGNAGSFDLADEASPIVGIKKLNEFLVVYKERSIYVGRLVDSISVFNFTLQKVGVGLLNNRCIVQHNGLHYFLARDGNIYAFNGVRTEPVASQIESQIFARWNNDRLETNFSRKNIYDRALQFYVTTGNHTFPNESWNIRYDTSAIFYDTVNSLTASEDFKDTSSQITWDEDTKTWDQHTTRWDEGAGGTGFEFPIFGTSDKTVVKEDRNDLDDASTIIDQEFVSKDFHFDAQEQFKRWLRIEFWAKGISVDLAYSTDFGATWNDIPKNSSNQSFTLTSSFDRYDGYFDASSGYVRFRFRNNRSEDWFALRQFTVEGNIREDLDR